MIKTPYKARIIFLVIAAILYIPVYVSMYKLHENKLLVSTGAVTGQGIFSDSVLFLQIHRLSGAYGLIINKKVPEDDNQIASKYRLLDIPLYIGGPLKYPEEVFILRTTEKDVRIDALNSLGNNEEEIFNKLKSLRGKDNLRLVFGYSAWRPFQLSLEIQKHYWGIIDLNHNFFDLNKSSREIWDLAIEKLLLIKPERKGKIL
jgi:putative transcriptional regulator